MNNIDVIFIFGPTASGKTGFAEALAHYMLIEIINMDSVQMYTPCSIGTAKPDWQNSPIQQHLFDIADQPIGVTAHAYVQQAERLMHDVIKRGNMPVFVGGSGFYLKSLLFQQPSIEKNSTPIPDYTGYTDQQLWDKLHVIDAERASAIHVHDRYRTMRALEIWHITGCKPSDYKPVYAPIFRSAMLIHVYKEKKVLHTMIDQRIDHMLMHGWIDETRALIGTPWQNFVTQKGFIGYTELVEYIQGKRTLDEARQIISIQTKQYAKRQETFWRMLQREVKAADKEDRIRIVEYDLTNVGYDLYIKQLLNDIKTF